MTKEQKNLVDRIDELCVERQMTYYGLAYSSAIPLSTLLHIMDGTTKNPGIFTISKICDGLEITMSEFFAPLDLAKQVSWLKE